MTSKVLQIMLAIDIAIFAVLIFSGVPPFIALILAGALVLFDLHKWTQHP